MTPERLTEIRADDEALVADLGTRPRNRDPWYMLQWRGEELATTFRRAAIDRRDLLAELDRLSAENETMREAMTVSTFKARDFCFFCGSPSDGPHVTGCSVA